MPTIKEVAEVAGVAVGTVSHVITGSVNVSEPLRRRVEAAIRKLDYHPNHVARSLKTSRTRTLGIIVPDLTIPFFPQVIRGAETAAWKRGYSLVAVNSTDSAERERELLLLLRSQQVEGILLVMAAASASMTQVKRMIDAGIPLVCLDRVPDGIPVDSVCVDDMAAAEMGVQHLISMGYRRIAVVTGPMALKNEQMRFHGYKQCLMGAGIEVDPDLIWTGNLRTAEVAAMCAERLRDPVGRPDAIFSTNGPTALGALRGMRECMLSTPNDIGFATFDELTVDDLFTPSITTVVQPSYEIGRHAAEMLLRRIEEDGRTGDAIAMRLTATLIIRESSRRVGGPTSHKKVRAVGSSANGSVRSVASRSLTPGSKRGTK